MTDTPLDETILEAARQREVDYGSAAEAYGAGLEAMAEALIALVPSAPPDLIAAYRRAVSAAVVVRRRLDEAQRDRIIGIVTAQQIAAFVGGDLQARIDQQIPGEELRRILRELREDGHRRGAQIDRLLKIVGAEGQGGD